MRRSWISAFVLLLCAAAPALSDDAAQVVPRARHADCVPGNGLNGVMREIAYRMPIAFWAASGGNWGLAQYQLNRLRMAMETAELDNPEHRNMLAEFETKHRDPLAEAVAAKNVAIFNRRFVRAIDGCNLCHAKLGLGFLHYQVPEAGGTGAFLDFGLKTEPGTKAGP